MITHNYNRIGSDRDWREWSHHYFTADFTVTDRTGKFLYYKRIVGPKCRQCRKLPGHRRWTGERVCACGNPFINGSSVDRLPLVTRLARGIKPWDKPLTAQEKSQRKELES